MSSLIKRNDTLQQLLKYWNHNEPSNIGMGRLSRDLGKDGVYLIRKSWGRQDLALFNVRTSITINGVILEEGDCNQLSLEPSGVYYDVDTPSCVKSHIQKWILDNKAEICIQLHYLKWFNSLVIKDNTLEETISILTSYSFNQEEAEDLFLDLSY